MNELRHTITINDRTFKEVRSKGLFGESYSDLLLRLLRELKKYTQKRVSDRKCLESIILVAMDRTSQSGQPLGIMEKIRENCLTLKEVVAKNC